VLRFSCPQCDRALRAPEDKAGSRVQCPECGNKFVVPAAIDEPEPPEVKARLQDDEFDEDDEPQVRRKKKKRSRASGDGARGKTAIVAITTILLGWYVVSTVLTYVLAGPPPANLGGAPTNATAYRIGQIVGIGCVFSLIGIPIIFLLMGHNWARFALAAVLLMSTVCTLPLIGFAIFAGADEGVKSMLTILQGIVTVGINIGFGLMLLISKDIKAYTEG
jgi:hypothetical protein